MSMKNSDNNNNETDRFSKSEKPVFLYTVIGVLTVAVIALGAVSFLSLNHLVTLQQKVQTLSNTVQDSQLMRTPLSARQISWMN